MARGLDVRLFNTSQLAGYTRQPDLALFLHEITGIEYQLRQDLAPTKEILRACKQGTTDWSTYEKRYANILMQRQVEANIPTDLLVDASLLCSEPVAENALNNGQTISPRCFLTISLTEP